MGDVSRCVSCDKISQALPLLFLGAGQRSYVELLRERRESLGARLVGSAERCMLASRLPLSPVCPVGSAEESSHYKYKGRKPPLGGS